MTPDELQQFVKELCVSQGETEWIEFKCNNCNHEEMGEYISALSNSAALHSKPRGYMVWGICDVTHKIVGTQFLPKKKKVGGQGKNGNQELESWLLNHLTPGIEACFHEGLVDGLPVVVLEIQAAFSHPVRFKNNAFIRVGSYKKNLREYPEKERKLWEHFQHESFEMGIARESLTDEQVFQEIDYSPYFELSDLPLPDNRATIIQRLKAEGIIKEVVPGRYAITNIGAVLFAHDLERFGRLGRKALRVVMYQGPNRVNTLKEHLFKKGYAAAFKEIIAYINDQLPRSEEIGAALRREVRLYPEIAIRELVANALIHQDFVLTGNGPMVEIFDNRIEITNPGRPLIDTLRFIDEPPRSRNEGLARFMRRLKICEERGSGIDKVIFNVELFQLPPPDFRVTDTSTITVLFSPTKLTDMSKDDKIRACYQHASLQWVSGTQMTNISLRNRLGIKDSNYPIASRIIKDSIKKGLLKSYGDQKAKKTAKYVPFWA
ncbi:MAG: putative DNA binding domain-containing protein [Verrucomicrobia bacterium]|nr:putative DNA binding domain-containing protein [Verrucomicrobiota bacterium]